jgi:hypothetical protein
MVKEKPDKKRQIGRPRSKGDTEPAAGMEKRPRRRNQPAGTASTSSTRTRRVGASVPAVTKEPARIPPSLYLAATPNDRSKDSAGLSHALESLWHTSMSSLRSFSQELLRSYGAVRA